MNETTEASKLRHGQTLVGTDRVRLVGMDGDSRPLSFKVHRGILVRCPGSTAETNAGRAVNTHPVYIGDEGVTVDNGMAIPPGNTITVPIDDPAGLWVISTGASQHIQWMSL